MRLPGAALLIALGLLLLYLATSGNLDRLGKAWSAIKTPTDATATPDANAASGVLDPAAYHAGMLLHTLTPGVAVVQPGGMN